jgi:hypothetical protein
LTVPPELVNPNTDAIKKRFQKWKQGHLFAHEDFRKFLIILRFPYNESDSDLRTCTYIMVNLFTLTQVEVMRAGIHPELIKNKFTLYPNYKSLVRRRYDRYKTLGALSAS